MSFTLETLEKLERKITISIPAQDVSQRVTSRLNAMTKKVKMDGFRPGKVPLSVVRQQYGYSVHMEVVEERINTEMNQALNEAKWRVAGQPQFQEVKLPEDNVFGFESTFEVMPEVLFGDLSGVQVERWVSEMTPEARERTIELLRKQFRTFAPREAGAAAEASDKVKVDFVGKIDGEAFEGGTAEGYTILLGENQMLPAFEEAVLGMKIGESKTFQLPFPENYPGAEVAGKTADFMVTVHEIEASVLPEIDEAFISQVGAKEGTLEALNTEIDRNLGVELKNRLDIRNRRSAMEALAIATSFDLPQVLVEADVKRMTEAFQKNNPNTEISAEQQAWLVTQAEKNVKMSLMIGEFIKIHNLYVTDEQINAYLQELASVYEEPAQVVAWYKADQSRMEEAQMVVVERNIAGKIFEQASITEKQVAFDDVMRTQG